MKSVEPCSREQSGANSELSFELGLKLSLSLQWFCKILFSEPTYFELKVFDSWTCSSRKPEKKYFEPHNREQCRAFSEFSFELDSILSLQWLCKRPFSVPISFELKVFIAEHFCLERQKKKLNFIAGNRAEQIQSYLLN